MKYIRNILAILFVIMMLLSSCEDFYNPDQPIDVNDEELFDDWYEYRSVAMGLYALQQNLVEQIVVLGELRGDMLKVTENADADLIEIYNYNVSKDNKYASPVNFFKLISACNNFIHVIEANYPEVLDPKSEITNYHRIYGEALCMRAWTYFNAVRIYGEVPFIPQSLVTFEEIQNFVNSSGTYIDSVRITFGIDGYTNNDTTFYSVDTLNKQLFDQRMVIDYFTNELENNIRAVGVDYSANNTNEHTWEVTTWNTNAMHALLGQMYFTDGNYSKAAAHFESIIKGPSDDTEFRYQLTDAFANENWINIFTGIDYREHIYTVYFEKDLQQKNQLMNLFFPVSPYKYMLKPTKAAVDKFETSWVGTTLAINVANPSRTRTINEGFPGDPFRGNLMSYAYYNIGTKQFLPFEVVHKMMLDRREGNMRQVHAVMDEVDTVVVKYAQGQALFEDDMCFPIYRAGSIHLYLAEIYNYWMHYVPSTSGGQGTYRTELNKAMGLVNNGEFFSIMVNRPQLGVRGRVGYGANYDFFDYSNVQYNLDPYTNEVIGFINLGTNTAAKQLRFEDKLLDERARETAFEGERFYDLVRIAKRRNDPSYLASRVSAKYPAGKREQIYNLLLDENNWYIHMFD